MITQKFLIKNENGLDVKAITKIVNVASGFSSNIDFTVNQNTADAKSIINLMALNVKCNEELLITIDGKDENEALKSLIMVFEECQII